MGAGLPGVCPLPLVEKVWKTPIATSLSRAVALATRGAAWERSPETDPRLRLLRLHRCSRDLLGSEAG